MTSRPFDIRVSAKDVDSAIAALRAFGAEGAGALQRLQKGAAELNSALRSKDIEAYGQELDRLRARYNPLFALQQQYRESLRELNNAYKVGAISSAEFAAALAREKSVFAERITAMNGGTRQAAGFLAMLGGAAQGAETRVKGAVTVLRDATGTLQLLGPAAGGAAGALANLGGHVGNVGDAFGILGGIIARHPLLVLGAAVLGVGAAMLLLSERTDKARVSSEAFSKVLLDDLLILDRSAEATSKLAEARRLLDQQHELGKARSEGDTNLRLLRAQRDALEAEIRSRRGGGAGSGLDDTGGLGQPLTENLDQLELRLRSTEALIALNERRVRQLTEAQRQLSPALQAVTTEGARQAKLLDELGQVDARAYEAMKQQAAQLKTDLRPATKVYADEVARLASLRKAGLITIEEEAAQLQNLNHWLHEQNPATAAARKASEEYRRELEQAIQAEAKREASLERYIQDLQVKSEASREDATEEKVRLAIHEAQSKLLDELGQKTRDLTEDERQRIRIAVEEKAAFEARRKEAEKFANDAARETERTWSRAADGIQDSLKDAFKDGFSESGKTAVAFFDRLKALAISTAADIAAAMVIRPVMGTALQAVGAPAEVLQKFGLRPGQGFNLDSALSTAGGFGSIGGLPGGLSAAVSLYRVLNGASLTTGSAAIGDLFAGAGKLVGGHPQTFFDAGSAFSSPAASIGSFAVNLLLDKILGDRGIGSTIGSTIGGIAGSFFGPIGSIAGSALGNILGGLFGGKASVGPNANATINYDRGKLTVGGLGADNGGDTAIARELAEAATKGVTAVLDRIGGRLLGLPGAGDHGQTQVGYFKGEYFSRVMGEQRAFKSGNEAVADFVRRSLLVGDVQGMDPNVRLALDRSTDRTPEELGERIEYAAAYRNNVRRANASPFGRQAQLTGFQIAAEDAGRQQLKDLRDFIDRARDTFGADSTQAAEARAAMRNRALGLLGSDNEGVNRPLEGLAASLAQTRANLQALKDVLIETGDSAEQAQAKIDAAYGRETQEARRQIQQDIRLANASTSARQAQLVGLQIAGEEAGRGELRGVRNFLDAAREAYGANSGEYAAARGAARNRVLGLLGPADEGADAPLDGVALGLAELRARLQGLKDVLIETGDSAEDAQRRIDEAYNRDVRKRAKLFNEGVGSGLRALAGNDNVDQAIALKKQIEQEGRDAAALGGATAGLTQFQNQRVSLLISTWTADQIDAWREYLISVGELTDEARARLDEAAARARAREANARALQGNIMVWAGEQSVMESRAATAKQLYLEALNAEVGSLDQAAQGFGRLAERLGDFRNALLLDARFAPGGVTGLYEEAGRQLADVEARLQSDDAAVRMRAGEQLESIARAFLDASLGQNAKGPAFFADRNRVLALVANTETAAQRNARNLEEQLRVARDALRAMQGAETNTRSAADLLREMREADRAAANARGAAAAGQWSAFQSLAGDFLRDHGAAQSEAEKRAVYDRYAGVRDQLIGGIGDVETLQRIGETYYRGNFTDAGALAVRGALYAKGELPRFRFGGDMIVPGSGAPDTTLVQFMASRGEHVRVRTPSQVVAEGRRDQEIVTGLATMNRLLAGVMDHLVAIRGEEAMATYRRAG